MINRQEASGHRDTNRFTMMTGKISVASAAVAIPLALAFADAVSNFQNHDPSLEFRRASARLTVLVAFLLSIRCVINLGTNPTRE